MCFVAWCSAQPLDVIFPVLCMLCKRLMDCAIYCDWWLFFSCLFSCIFLTGRAVLLSWMLFFSCSVSCIWLTNCDLLFICMSIFSLYLVIAQWIVWRSSIFFHYLLFILCILHLLDQLCVLLISRLFLPCSLSSTCSIQYAKFFLILQLQWIGQTNMTSLPKGVPHILHLLDSMRWSHWSVSLNKKNLRRTLAHWEGKVLGALPFDRLTGKGFGKYLF